MTPSGASAGVVGAPPAFAAVAWLCLPLLLVVVGALFPVLLAAARRRHHSNSSTPRRRRIVGGRLFSASASGPPLQSETAPLLPTASGLAPPSRRDVPDFDDDDDDNSPAHWELDLPSAPATAASTSNSTSSIFSFPPAPVSPHRSALTIFASLVVPLSLFFALLSYSSAALAVLGGIQLLLASTAFLSILFESLLLEPLSNPSVRDELDKRFAQRVLRNVAAFYILYGAVVTFVFVSQHVGAPFAVTICQALASIFMATLVLSVSERIPMVPIRRSLINGKKPSPELEASILSRLSFSWFNPMMRFGSTNDIKLDDLWSVNASEYIDSNLNHYFKLRNRYPNASLLFVLFVFNRKIMVTQSLLLCASTVLYFSGPFFLNRILAAIDDPILAYAYVFGMLCATVARFSIEGQVNLIVKKMGIRNANVLAGLIYRKALRRSPQIAVEGDESGASVGKIVSLMSVDSTSVGQWIGMFYSPAVTLLQILGAVVALIYVLGWAALAGVSLLVVLLFSGAPLAGKLRTLASATKKFRDRRVTALNELLQGIKIIKLFAWESQFEKKINVLREQELNNIFMGKVVGAMNRILWFSAPLLTTFVTLFTYTVVFGNQLTATVAFTALALFNLLKAPLHAFPDTLVQLIDTWVSFKRIDLFLQEEDLEAYTNPSSNKVTDSSPSIALGFENATFEWSENAKTMQEPERPSLFSLSWFTGKKKPAESPSSTADQSSEPTNVFRLTDINGQFPTSQLSVIVGATGAGKSSLLLALLGEMRRVHGRRSCPVDPSIASSSPTRGSPSELESIGVAYVPQVPWLLNATIRDNILFGNPYNAEKYHRVLEACALVKDLETLDGGDMTEIGEKGINLSGGQKQRVSLARAVYSDSPWVLLDDPLSAVDAPTARHIYEHCILSALSGRTRLLVTNAINLAVPRADFLAVVHAGRIAAQGPVDRVLTDIADPRAPSSPFIDSLRDSADLIRADRARLAREPINPVAPTRAAGKGAAGADDADDAARKEKARLVDDEGMASGNVRPAVYYLYYVSLGGLPFLLILLAGYAVNIGLTVFLDVIVARWTQSYESSPSVAAAAYSFLLPALRAFLPPAVAATVATSSDPLLSFRPDPTSLLLTAAGNATAAATAAAAAAPADPTPFYLKFYALFAVLTIATIIVRLVVIAYIQKRAGRAIHRGMMDRVLGAPLRFFEVTPLGRIMNRFSKDLKSVDSEVAMFAGNMLYQIMVVAFVTGTISVVVPPLLLLLPPLGYIYARVGLYYIRTSRSLNRIDSVAQSPIYSHFGETLAGVSVIRAFHRTARFSAESSRRFNDANRASYFLTVSDEWFTVRMNLISSLLMFAAGLLIVFSGVDASIAGLCLNLTLQLSETLIYWVQFWGWLEMAMNAVERCDDYLKLEQEAPASNHAYRPPPAWPQEGRISIRDLEMRYSKDTPLVLHGISAEIAPREKVGIVGRTGAGKSTLTLALFRIIEPAGGTILVDGVDIRTLGLADLRSNLTIIPQDPVLFAGTVRFNLDPFDALDDATLWAALRRARLTHSDGSTTAAADSTTGTTATNEFRITLDTPVAEGGANLSAGQRQQLCLARALARSSKLIVLDEATASVDPDTDARIQETIREELAHCTVLTVAHRLRTVADYDRIVVLDAGRVVENAHPHTLICGEESGVFRRMCVQSGEFDELAAIARKAYERRAAGNGYAAK